MRHAMHRLRGLTMVELMVGLVVIGVIMMLAIPSFKRQADNQRLRSITYQLVTDIQLARAEAASRGEWARVVMRNDTSQTCYSIYTSTVAGEWCDCLLGAGSACTSADNAREIRTVQVPRSLNVTVLPGQLRARFAFDPKTGALASNPTDAVPAPLGAFAIDTQIDTGRTLRTTINAAGRVTMCSPSGSSIQETPC